MLKKLLVLKIKTLIHEADETINQKEKAGSNTVPDLIDAARQCELLKNETQGISCSIVPTL